MAPLLEYFIYIAKYNNLTHAAAELNITQQCLSNYLKKLEDYYGVTLFNRKPTMSLTPFGKAVYKRALMIQSIQNEIEASVPYHLNPNPVGIGFSMIHIYQANQLFDIGRFIKENKDASIKLKHASLESLASMLKSGDLDIYFTSFTHATSYPMSKIKPAVDFINKKAMDFYYKAIVRPDFLKSYFPDNFTELVSQWRQEGVSISQWSSMPLVLLNQLQKPLFRDSKEKGYHISISAECDNVFLTMELVKAGIGFSVVPRFTNLSNEADGLYQFNIKDPELLTGSTVYCCTTETALKREVVRNLWNMIGSENN